METTNRKPQFREGLYEHSDKYHDKSFKNLTDLEKSKTVARFFILEIYNKLHADIFPDNVEDLEEYITDGSKDAGVDLFFTNENQHYIFQIKFHSRNNIPEKEEDVAHFLNVFDRLNPKTRIDPKKINETLKANIANVNWEEDNFKLMFLSLGKKTAGIEYLEKKGIEDRKSGDLHDLSERSEFEFFGIEELNSIYRTMLDQPEGGLDEIEIKFSDRGESNSWYEFDGPDGIISYIGTLNAPQIFELYKTKKDNLFNLNIRNYLGNNVTNKNIIKKAGEDPDRFIFYNNGISAIAQRVEKIDSQTLICKDFSIINGAQTFKSVYRGYLDDNVNLKNLHVVLRLTVDPNMYSNPEFVENITRYNNTQNVVKISDFKSNDSVQKHLIRNFKKFVYSGKIYKYKNKRGERAKPNEIIIPLEAFCKYVHCFLHGPISFKGGLTYLFSEDKDGGYSKLFAETGTNNIMPKLPTDKFRLYSSIWFLFEYLEKEFKDIRRQKKDEDENNQSSETDISSSRALQGFELMTYTFGLILKRILVNLELKDINEFLIDSPFTNPEWKKNEGIVSIVNSILQFTVDALTTQYTNAADNKDFIHRNWLRRQSTGDSIQNYINQQSMVIRILSEEFVKSPLYKE